MLQFSIENNRELVEILYGNNYNRVYDTVLNRTYCGPADVKGLGFIYSQQVGDINLPLVMNGFNYMTQTIGLDYSEGHDQETYLNMLVRKLKEDDIAVDIIYTNDMDKAKKAIADLELYKIATPDAIQALFNKCTEQLKVRNGLEDSYESTLYVHKTSKQLVVLTNVFDANQASQFYLAYGLIPVIFKDVNDKLNETELAFFKTLVNRSQVKRITNVTALEDFDKVVHLINTKYKDVVQQTKLKLVVTSIVENNIKKARNNVTKTIAESEITLEKYEELRAQYYKAQDLLNNLTNRQEETMTEITTAVSMKEIYNVEVNNNYLVLYIKAALEYIDTEEAEIIIDNMPDCFAKTFLKDIFLDQKYKLMVLGKFIYPFDGASTDLITATTPSNMEQANAIINPHIFFYNCLGDYVAELKNARAKQDLLIFNNLAIASTKSLNFRDGAVINRFRDWLNSLKDETQYGYDIERIRNAKCLIDAEGNAHSIKEIYLDVPPTEVQPIDVQDL